MLKHIHICLSIYIYVEIYMNTYKDVPFTKERQEVSRRVPAVDGIWDMHEHVEHGTQLRRWKTSLDHDQGPNQLGLDGVDHRTVFGIVS